MATRKGKKGKENDLSRLLNKNEKLLKRFWFKNLDTQQDVSVIELHTQLNQNYNELQMKIKTLYRWDKGNKRYINFSYRRKQGHEKDHWLSGLSLEFMNSKFEEMMLENCEMKQRIFLLEKVNKELNKVLKQVNEKSMKNILHLDPIERDQKANSIVLSGVEENGGKKYTEVAL